jgi:hypothetical protein
VISIRSLAGYPSLMAFMLTDAVDGLIELPMRRRWLTSTFLQMGMFR